MKNTAPLFSLWALLLPVAALSQATARPEILIVGSYHMANPGHDIHDIHADDVLSPRRQQEMAQLLDVLERFHPTAIAIESDPSGPRPQQYLDYLAGKYTLGRNEIEQVGFRLAKDLGLPAIYPVDADGDFPYEPLVNWAKANGKGAAFDSLDAAAAVHIQAEDSYLKSHTLLEMLDLMNSDSVVAQELGAYFGWVRYGDRWDDAGPDLLAAWYQRNIRIYRNIVALIKSPNDRILVIYGAGHLGLLRQDVASDPAVRLRKLAEFR